jgi:hypothetical protein
MRLLLLSFLAAFGLNVGIAILSKEVSGGPANVKAAQPIENATAALKSPQPATPAPAAGFRGVPWGADKQAILSHFPGEAKELAQKQTYGNQAYADVGIANYEVGGSRLDLFFQMDSQTDRLKQVLLSRSSDNAPSPTMTAEYDTLSRLLTEKYGEPVRSESSMRWLAAETMIELNHSHFSIIKTEFLTLRYFPSGGGVSKL